MSDLPKGFTCSKCQKDNQYPMYVYSHWYESLLFSCECGQTYNVLRGVATARRAPRKAKEAKA